MKDQCRNQITKLTGGGWLTFLCTLRKGHSGTHADALYNQQWPHEELSPHRDPHADGCPDSCIREDWDWGDCDCYSHNNPGDNDHEKNPMARGMNHKEFREFGQANQLWSEKQDMYVIKPHPRRPEDYE